MGQSFGKDSLKFLSLIGSICQHRGDLLPVCITLAVPKTVRIKSKSSKIGYILPCSRSHNILFNIKKRPEFLCLSSYG